LKLAGNKTVGRLIVVLYSSGKELQDASSIASCFLFDYSFQKFWFFGWTWS